MVHKFQTVKYCKLYSKTGKKKYISHKNLVHISFLPVRYFLQTNGSWNGSQKICTWSKESMHILNYNKTYCNLIKLENK